MSSTLIEPRKRGVNPDRLTDKERIFVEAYLANGLKGAAAAREANYATPAVAAAKLLRKPKIQAALGKALGDTLGELGLERQRVLKQLETALFLDPLDLFESDEEGIFRVRELNDIPEHIRSCITRLKCRTKTTDRGTETVVEIELMSKDKAQELALKYLGLLNGDLVNINVAGPTIDFDKLCRPPGDEWVEARIVGRE